jgi:putative transposase
MLEADHQFRRGNGHLHLPELRAALDACFTENVNPVSHNEDEKVS